MTPFAAYLLAAPKTEDAWKEGWRRFRDQTAMGHVEVDLWQIDDASLTLRMPISDASRQPFGLLHGGVSLMLAESAASMHSAWLADLRKVAPVGIDVSGTHVSGASQGTVEVVANAVDTGRTFIFHHVQVRHLEQDKVLCHARVTNYLRPHRHLEEE